MADAFQMGEDGNARLDLHPAHKTFSPAWHDQVDAAGKPFQHHADGAAV